MMTISDVAARLRIGQTTVKRMVKAGVLPEPTRIGARTLRWHSSEIEAAVERLAEMIHDLEEAKQ